ncbi:ABC-three component system protein [Leptospira alstonii]|uniref:ABC-three component system protein n=1 Tax=Leptospira alstonii TaxID=28452 RepID=UPI000773BBAF|nr:ABC-three component system protein [Leptospira alstonii]
MTNQGHTGSGDNIYIEGNATFQTIQKQPSILADIINELGSKLFAKGNLEEQTYDGYSITEKIEYNSVIEYKPVIEELKIYQGKLNIIYNEIEANGSNKKHCLLLNIRNTYLKVKGQFLKKNQGQSELQVIRDNSDAIIKTIENTLYEEIDKSNNINQNQETIKCGISIVLIDAFIRCKVLEEPLRNVSIQ